MQSRQYSIWVALLCAAAPSAVWSQEPVAVDNAAADSSEILVTGQRAALSRALERERVSDNLVNIIEAFDVGQFADQNVAETLQRVPGITLDRSEGEGRSISVRGLPSQFTPVTINGVRLGTSRVGDAQVALDSISNDQLGSIEVTKAVLPSQDADTLGGSVNLTSVSAFSRSGPELQLRADNFYSERAERSAPRLAATGLFRLFEDKLGIAVSLSYLDRPVDGVELESDSGLARVAARGTTAPAFLRPEEIALIYENGSRKRWNGTVNLEFRPQDGVELFARGTYARLEDNDASYRDIITLDSANGNDVIAVRPRGGRFDDGDIAKRLFFQNITDEVTTFSTGGSWKGEAWSVSGQLDWSRSVFDNPEALRGRFRERDIIVDLDGTDERFDIRLERGVRGTAGNPDNPALYQFDQLLAVEEYRTDTVRSARLDLARKLDIGGWESEIAFGGKVRLREKDNDREEFSGNPGGAGFSRTLADVPLFTQDTGFGYDSFFPALDPSRALFRDARSALLASNPNFQRADLSRSGDFNLTEDVFAGYLQATVNPSQALRIVAGVRVEHTRTGSQGFLTEFDASGLGAAGGTGTIIDLGTIRNSYTDFFPGVHLRWDAASNLLVRASYNRGLQRPDFDDSRNLLRVQFDAAEPFNTRDLFAGNPFLNPLRANQFDATVAWYPTRDTVVQVSGFYKQLNDFFFTFSGRDDSLAALPLVIPAGIDTNFRRITTTVNGDRATVRGLEFQLQHNFTYLPGILAGLFTQANLTLTDSSAVFGLRPGERFSLPEQRDVVGNLSVGYEDSRLLLRLAGNYLGKALLVAGSDSTEDLFAKSDFNLDLNTRFRVSPQFQITFDAINLTDEAEIGYYQADGSGGLVSFNSGFGRTYQLGLRMTF